MKTKTQRVVGHFEIPEELAKELSENLVRQTIKERLLLQLLDEPEKYIKVENDLVPITAKIEAIKMMITKKYVPNEYNEARFIWNYNGFEVDGNQVEIIQEA
jgi:hypothetical protein